PWLRGRARHARSRGGRADRGRRRRRHDLDRRGREDDRGGVVGRGARAAASRLVAAAVERRPRRAREIRAPRQLGVGRRRHGSRAAHVTLVVHEALGVLQPVETPYPDSPWVVLKFGGRSVATAENWAIIAGLLRRRLEEGVRPVVVHSALVGVSNALIDLLDTAVAGQPIEEKLDR